MATPAEEVDLEWLRDVVVARIRGEVDLANAAAVRQRLLGAVPNTATALVLDLSGTRYLDSSGVRLIFELATRLQSRGQRLDLVVPDDSVIRPVLVLTEIEQVVPIFASVDAALRR